MTPTASIKLTEGDAMTVSINFQFGSQIANENTATEIANASSAYLGLEKTFCKTFLIILLIVPLEKYQ